MSEVAPFDYPQFYLTSTTPRCTGRPCVELYVVRILVPNRGAYHHVTSIPNGWLDLKGPHYVIFRSNVRLIKFLVVVI